MTKQKYDPNRVRIENRKARHDYFIDGTLECGISLRGNEVKSVAAGKASLRDAWARTENGELILKNMHIAKWETAMPIDVDEKRDRKLLAHKPEIRKLERLTSEKGVTLIPLSLYFSNGKIKVEIGICRGKHSWDKREALKEKDMKRESERAGREGF